jgi:hypothetical protein
MSRLLALFIFSSIFFFNFYSGASILKSSYANVTPTVTPTPQESAESDVIKLDRNIVTRPCPLGYKCFGTSDKNMSVTVTISNAVSKNDLLNYNYAVSGGRIIGEGARVIWDLTGVQPGTYEIAVDTRDISGTRIQTATKLITVQDYLDGGDACLSCPEFFVVAQPLPTQVGETIIFTAGVSGGSAGNITYNWTVSSGKIIEGQGTPTIKVATNPKMAGKVVKATANFKWDCSEICNNTASASGLMTTKKHRDK